MYLCFAYVAPLVDAFITMFATSKKHVYPLRGCLSLLSPIGVVVLSTGVLCSDLMVKETEHTKKYCQYNSKQEEQKFAGTAWGKVWAGEIAYLWVYHKK